MTKSYLTESSPATGGMLTLVGFGPGAEDHLTPIAKKAIENADVVIGYRTYIDLVVLDEINIALRYNYIDVPQVLALLDERPEHQNIVLTGRNAPDAILERADLVTEMKMIKHPFEKGILARKGVDF